MNKIYTPKIIDYTEAIIQLLCEDKNNNFFKDEIQHEELGKKTFYNLIADQATQNFLNRTDQEIELDKEQLEKIFKIVIITDNLENLKLKGLIGSFDYEGEEVYFATEKGKKLKNDR